MQSAPCVFYEAIPKLALDEKNSVVTLPIKRPILICAMCHTRSWAMLLRIEEHLSFQKGIALAGACTPYHVVTFKLPSNSHGQFTWSMHPWEGIICVPCCKGQSKYRNKSTIHLESSQAYGNYEMLYQFCFTLESSFASGRKCMLRVL